MIQYDSTCAVFFVLEKLGVLPALRSDPPAIRE